MAVQIIHRGDRKYWGEYRKVEKSALSLKPSLQPLNKLVGRLSVAEQLSFPCWSAVAQSQLSSSLVFLIHSCPVCALS